MMPAEFVWLKSLVCWDLSIKKKPRAIFTKSMVPPLWLCRTKFVGGFCLGFFVWWFFDCFLCFFFLNQVKINKTWFHDFEHKEKDDIPISNIF